MSVARVAVLQFPGLNCEEETMRVLHKVGVEPGRKSSEFASLRRRKSACQADFRPLENCRRADVPTCNSMLHRLQAIP